MPAKQARESIEAELELPISKPLVERMVALGMNQDAIDHAQIWLNALSKIVSGRGDELPDHLKRELGEETDAELMGAELGGYRPEPQAGLIAPGEILRRHD